MRVLQLINSARRTIGGFTLAAGGVLASCGDINEPSGPPPLATRVRVINSIFQFTDAASTPSLAAPRTIDVLIDSAAGLPSAIAIAPAGLSSGDPAGYRTLSTSVHSFAARIASTPPSRSLYTVAGTGGTIDYLPKQYLGPAPYTVIVAGLVSSIGVAAPGGVPFVALLDDPFQPPKVGGAYQARFRVVNAAPFTAAAGTGATVNIYLTPGTVAPTTAQIPLLAPMGTAVYRNASAYFNVDVGNYVLTLMTGGTMIAQQTLTFAAGTVQTFVLQSTAPSLTAASHRVSALSDATF